MSQTGNLSKGYLQTFGEIIKVEGPVGLWRGNFVGIIRAFPSKAVLFSTNDFYKNLLVSINFNNKPEIKGQIPAWISFLGGSLAGLTAQVLTYPLDLIKTRISATLFMKGVESTTNTSTSMTMTLYRIVRIEGPLALYKGVTPSLIGAIPYEGIKFLSFDLFRNEISILFPGDETKIIVKSVSGGLAGIVAGLLLYPNDTVRKNMQMEGQKKTSMLKTIKRLYGDGGVKRFFRGLLPYMLRMAPSAAIQFGTYEALKQAFL